VGGSPPAPQFGAAAAGTGGRIIVRPPNFSQMPTRSEISKKLGSRGHPWWSPIALRTGLAKPAGPRRAPPPWRVIREWLMRPIRDRHPCPVPGKRGIRLARAGYPSTNSSGLGCINACACARRAGRDGQPAASVDHDGDATFRARWLMTAYADLDVSIIDELPTARADAREDRGAGRHNARDEVVMRIPQSPRVWTAGRRTGCVPLID